MAARGLPSRGSGAAENVRVVLRVRPLTRKEVDRHEDELIRVATDQTVQVRAGRRAQEGGAACLCERG